VVNLTPPERHRAVVETALELGCHVLGEKPIATTLDDARALVRAAEHAGRTYAVMQNRRFEHGIRTLRDGLAAGRIGAMTMLACDFFKAPHFGGFREEMESPLLLDMAIHQFDQARFVAGVEPVAVSCHELNPAGSWYEGDAVAICTFELADGSIFSYRGSWAAEGFGTSWNGSWRVVGTAGTALWDGEGDPVAEIARPPEEPELLYPVEHADWERTWDGPTGHAGCLDEMLAALARGRRPETDAADNLKSFAMVLAALTSAREGRRVELGELIRPVFPHGVPAP
jgi:predicted dehydrogenase